MGDFNPWADSKGAPYRWGSNFSLGTGDWYDAQQIKEERDSIWSRQNSESYQTPSPNAWRRTKPERKGDVDWSRLKDIVADREAKAKDPSIWR